MWARTALSLSAPRSVLLGSSRRLLSSASTTAATAAAATSSPLSDNDPSDHSTNYQLVIVGTGWAGYQMYTNCKKHRADIELTVGRPVDIVVVSKRNVRTRATRNVSAVPAVVPY